jgi:PAP2 superfamily
MVTLLCVVILVTNCIKDFCCLPRPPSPPVVHVCKAHVTEYGFPSSHSGSAVVFWMFWYLEYYVVHSRDSVIDGLFDTQRLIILTLCFTGAFIVSFSRLYLGVHSLADILGGQIIGSIVLYIWSVHGRMLDIWLFSGNHVPLIMLFGACILIAIHPRPVDDCPCFVDSVCFLGSLYGVLCGIFHLHLYSNVPTSINGVAGFPSLLSSSSSLSLFVIPWTQLIARPIVGLPLVLGIRAILKASCKFALAPLLHENDMSCGRHHHMNMNMKNIMSIFLVFDYDVISKMIAYTGLGWTAVCGAPMLFHALQI